MSAKASEDIVSPPLHVRFVPVGASIIPGISGMHFDGLSLSIIHDEWSDSHAHILEYGATQLLPLESAKTIPGRLFIKTPNEIINLSHVIQMLLLLLGSIY